VTQKPMTDAHNDAAATTFVGTTNIPFRFEQTAELYATARQHHVQVTEVKISLESRSSATVPSTEENRC